MVLKITCVLSYSQSFHQPVPVITIPCSRVARARYSRRRQEEDDEEKEEEEISRGCVVEMNMVALTRASPYRRIITF